MFHLIHTDMIRLVFQILRIKPKVLAQSAPRIGLPDFNIISKILLDEVHLPLPWKPSPPQYNVTEKDTENRICTGHAAFRKLYHCVYRKKSLTKKEKKKKN